MYHCAHAVGHDNDITIAYTARSTLSNTSYDAAARSQRMRLPIKFKVIRFFNYALTERPEWKSEKALNGNSAASTINPVIAFL